MKSQYLTYTTIRDLGFRDFDVRNYLLAHVTSLSIAGMWHSYNTFYTMYSLIIMVAVCLHILSEIMFLVLDSAPLEVFAEVLYLSSTGCVGVYKAYQFYVKRSPIQQLFNRLNSDIFRPLDTKSLIIFEKTVRFSLIIFYVYSMCSYSAILLYGLRPYLQGGKFVLPFFAHYPFEVTKSPYLLQFLRIYQPVACFLHACPNISVDNFFGSMIAYMACQCDLLCYNLRNLESDAKKQLVKKGIALEYAKISHEIDKCFKNCVQHHKEIIRFCSDLENTSSMSIVAQFGTSIILICVVICQISIQRLIEHDNWEDNADSQKVPFGKLYSIFALLLWLISSRIKFVTLLNDPLSEMTKELLAAVLSGILLFVSFSEILLYCWFGNELIYSSRNIAMAAYESNWENYPISYQKKVMFFMFRSQEDIKMLAANFFCVDITTFIKILRSSWSYATVLREKS